MFQTQQAQLISLVHKYLISGGADKLLYLDCGDNKEVEIKEEGGTIVIEEKQTGPAGNQIWYSAATKLSETTTTWDSGLHTNAFNTTIISHMFSNGAGVITFAEDVTNIGICAFHTCPEMTSISIPNTVTDIGGNAFHNCGFETITLPNSVINLDTLAFFDAFADVYSGKLYTIICNSQIFEYNGVDNYFDIILANNEEVSLFMYDNSGPS